MGGGDDVVGERRGSASESSSLRRIGTGKSFKLWRNSTSAASGRPPQAMVGARGVLPGRHWRGWGARHLPSTAALFSFSVGKFFPVSIFLMR